MLVPVILSGGAGTRLWPVSREAFPKPFIKLADGLSLLQKTYKRAIELIDTKNVVTVTNREYFFQSRDAYSAVRPSTAAVEEDWLLEPVGRNTAAAILLAAMHIQARFGSQAIMLVLAADHLIEDGVAFESAVQKAMQLARKGLVVTFGVPPTRPETGFGYIEAGKSIDDVGNQVIRFIEKPDRTLAKVYAETEGFFWNAGIFCVEVGTIMNEFCVLAPDLYERATRCYEAISSADRPIVFPEVSFTELPDISFDYAIMERTTRAAVVSANFGWSDIGSWEAIAKLGSADAEGNKSDGETLIVDSRNCYLRSESRLIAAVGLDDIMVIDTDDALLVAHKRSAQDVKAVAVQLKKDDHPIYKLHRTVHRPWGTYTILEAGNRFKIKRIVVRPGERLSSQMHYHRNEHWIVVSGTARILQEGKSRLLLTNQSTYIEAGVSHRLENPGLTDLVLIEVQSGDYLGEDDIVRFDDAYGRV